MTCSGDTCQALPFADYRRAARRLRTVYADRPASLYRQLAELGRRADAASKQDTSPRGARVVRSRVIESESIAVRPTVLDSAICSEAAAKFANLAALQFEGPVLRYSRRLALLRLADHMELPRFHASLLIALAQHQRAGLPGENVEASACASRWPWLAIASFLLIQSIILAGVWFVMR